MGFLSDIFDTAKDLIPSAISLFTGNPVGAVSDLPFFGSNDAFGVPSSSSSLGSMFGNFFDGVGAKDLFSAGSAIAPFFMTTAAQDQANAINTEQAAINRDFQREMFEKQFGATVGLTRDANAVSDMWQQQARLFNQDMAHQQMGFIRDMSNTQWQRGVEDMKAAGLSPMLAYSKGGASPGAGVGGYTSAGSASSGSVGLQGGSMAAPALSGVPAGFQSAYQMSMMAEQVDRMRAETRLIKEQTETSRSQGALNSAAYTRVLSEIDQLKEQHKLTQAEADLAKQRLRESVSRGNEHAARAILMELGIPEAVQMSKSIFSEGQVNLRGQYIPYLSDILRAIGTGSGAARALSH